MNEQRDHVLAPERGLTDDGNAHRLIDEHGKDLRYVPGAGWFAWDTCHWIADRDRERVRRARAFAQQLLDEAEAETEDEPRKVLRRHAKQSGSLRGIEAMLKLAESDRRIIVDGDDLDRDPHLLNCANGTVDLRTGEIRPHDRSDLCTKLVPIPYVPDAPRDAWLDHLRTTTGRDAELEAYVRRAGGYSITGETSEQVMFMPFGTGGNGKTTTIEAIRGVLGDYAADTPAETLLGKPHGGPQPELLRLRGARLVTAVETAIGSKMNETLIKRLTGGDAISGRMLYSNEVVEFHPAFKLWLVTNNKPTITERGHAMWRRIHLIPFLITIEEEARDRNLGAKLRDEQHGILAWLIEGAGEWYEHGLGHTRAVTIATEEYREEEDTLGAFIGECCITDPGVWTNTGQLFLAWMAWCKSNGIQPGTPTAFGRALKAANYPADKIAKGERIRRGLWVIPDWQQVAG